MKKGLTLLEVLVSLVLLTLFILGGMSLYATSVSQTRRSEILLTEIWLAKGKLDVSAENAKPIQEKSGSFPPPFQTYTCNIGRKNLPDLPDLTLITVTVTGPNNTKVRLERIVSQGWHAVSREHRSGQVQNDKRL